MCTIYIYKANQQGLKTAGCSLRYHFSPQFLACYLGVQAVEKPKKPPKFGKIEHQNQGDADGQIYPL